MISKSHEKNVNAGIRHKTSLYVIYIINLYVSECPNETTLFIYNHTLPSPEYSTDRPLECHHIKIIS